MKRTKKMLLSYYKKSKKLFLIFSLFFFIISGIFFFPSFINKISFQKNKNSYKYILMYVRNPNIWAKYNFLSQYEEEELKKIYQAITDRKLENQRDYTNVINKLLLLIENKIDKKEKLLKEDKEFLNFLLRRKKLGIKAGLQTSLYYFLAGIAFLIVAIFTGKKEKDK